MIANPTSKDILARANNALMVGDLKLATTLVAKARDAGDTSVDAIVLQARIAIAEGDFVAALTGLKAARQETPEEPALWIVSMDAAIAAGDQGQAKNIVQAASKAGLPKQFLELLEQKATSRNRSGAARLGSLPPAEFKAVVGLFQTKLFGDAEKAARKLLKAHPRVAPLHAVLGAAQAAQGKVSAAETSYTRALECDPDYAEARQQFGQLLMSTGKPDMALGQFQLAHALIPDSHILHKNLGLTLVALGRNKMAFPHLLAAHDLGALDPDLVSSIVQCAITVGDIASAQRVVQEAVSQMPDNPSLLVSQGHLLMEAEQYDAAEVILGRAVNVPQLKRRATEVLAELHQRAGAFDKAKAVLMESLDADPGNGFAFASYAGLGRIEADDPVVTSAMRAFDAGKVVPQSDIRFAYGLAKAMEDIGRDDRVFGYLRKAKSMQKRAYPLPKKDMLAKHLEQLRALWQMGAPESVVSPATPGPIFVTGMPRSGTTLVESLLASHSDVSAGGELAFLEEELRGAVRLASASSSALRGEDLAALQPAVAEKYGRSAQGRSHVTDKAIYSFRHLGLIRHVFPNARIIVVRRDPRDNCLSMFKNQFIDGTYRYTTDLAALGRAYLAHLDYLAFWREVCPNDFYELRYEDLIADPETGARDLIAAAGLDWQDGVMDFHKSRSSVKTLSSMQVRQPIYSSSVGAWRRFEADLSPLIKVLEAGGALHHGST